MPDQNTLQQIKNHVALGKEKAALALLLTYCTERNYHDLKQQLLVLSGNLQELNRKELNHTIATDDAMIEKNKIRDRILLLTQEAERYADATYRRKKDLGKVKAKAAKNGIYITATLGIIALLAGLYFIGNHFFDKSSAKMDQMNLKKDSLTLIDANVEDVTFTQGVMEEKEEEEIELENIKAISHSQSASDYEFPVIDFKFYNKGNAQAYINAFFIDVLEYVVDETPLLSMDFDFSDTAWNIYIINKGWGTAKRCKCQIESEELEKVFSPEALKFEQEIPPSSELNFKEKITFSLRSDSTDFSAIEADSVMIDDRTRVSCTFLSKGKEEKMEYAVHQEVLLRSSGFYPSRTIIGPNFVVSQRTANYLAYIDDRQKTHEYRNLYHIVTSEGAERFQITIGSNQSCKAKIQFRFLTNDEREIKSKPFVVDIWKPKGVTTPSMGVDLLKVWKE